MGRKAAFLKIEPFVKIYERHKGKLLPADEFLRNILEQDAHVPKDLSASWVSSFKEAIRVAGLLYDRPDQKTQIMESAVIAKTINVAASIPTQEDTVTVSEPKETITECEPPSFGISASGHNTRIALSENRYAVFSIPDRLTKREAIKIKAAITGMSSIIDSLVEDDKM